MKKILWTLLAILTVLLWVSAFRVRAADVTPIWQNDTVTNTLSFSDTFGHQVSPGTYNPATGAWIPNGAQSIIVGTSTVTGTCPSGQVLTNNAGVVGCVAAGSGTVTSVALTLPSWLTISGSPITTSGTLAITGTSEPANEVLASPNGSSGAMAPRALVAADISGLAATLASGTSAVTGSCTNGFVLYNNAGTLGCTAGGGSGTVTSVAMTVPAWLTVAGSPVTSAGTLAVTGTTEPQNLFLASPNGSTGAMTPRAIVGNDVASAFASPPPLGSTTPNTIASSGAFAISTTGTLAQIPTTAFASGVVPGINQSYAATGSSGTATSANINQLYLSSDNLTVAGAPGNAFFSILAVYNLGFGGVAANGGRIAGDFAIYQTSATESTHTFRDYVALHGTCSSTGDGGGSGTEKGSCFGMWSSGILTATATHMSAITNLENDMTVLAGASVLFKTGVGIGSGGNGVDAVHGSVVDAGLWFTSCTGGCVGYNFGIQFGRPDGFGGLGVATGGTLLATAVEVATIANGIDLTGGGSAPLGNTTITGNAWKSPGANQTTIIDGNGNFKANTVNIPSGASYSWGASLADIVVNTNMYFDNFVPGDWIFRTTGPVEEFRISAAGVLSSVGTAGVTCATGSPTSSFSAKNGLVTHC